MRERLTELPAAGREQPRTDAGERTNEAIAERRRARVAARWWENDSIAGELGLSEQQVADIAQARAELAAALRQSRQSLATASRGLREALATADREGAESLLASRVEALQARARAEAAWTRRVLAVLTDDQLGRLAEAHPPVVTTLFAPLR